MVFLSCSDEAGVTIVREKQSLVIVSFICLVVTQMCLSYLCTYRLNRADIHCTI